MLEESWKERSALIAPYKKRKKKKRRRRKIQVVDSHIFYMFHSLILNPVDQQIIYS